MSTFLNSKCKPVENLALTHSQEWLLDEMMKTKRPGWNTIEFLIKTKISMHPESLEKAIFYLLDKYENLRVKITKKHLKWVQEVYPLAEANPFAAYDFAEEGAASQMQKVKHVCIQARNWLSPERGNLVKVLFFKFSENEGRMWFCMHHAISDFVSVVLLSNEFMATYNSIVQGRELKWQTVRDYRKWLYLLEGYSRDVLLPSELEYWISLPWDKAKILPSDYPEKFYKDDVVREAIGNKTLINSYRTDTHLMAPEETAKVLGRYGAEMENILIAAFFLSVVNRMKMDWLDINVSYSGRNILPADYGVNVNRLLGFLASVRAMLLQKPAGESILLDIQHVVEQIKSIPNGGMGFVLISDYIKDDMKGSYWGFRRNPDIFFNYLGRVDTKFSNDQYEIVEEDIGLNLYPTEIRNSLLSFVVGIKQNQLFFQTNYSEEYFKAKTIDDIVHAVMDVLREIAAQPVTEKIRPNGVLLES